MGGRASCIRDPSSRREVVVMKENGEFLRFKEYIRVKDILAANPYHKLIRCCSQDRNNVDAVLPDSFQLSCNQLYLLLPREFFLTDQTYQNMLRLAAASSRNSASTYSRDRDSRNIPQLSGESANTKYNNNNINNKILLCSEDDDDDEDVNGDGDTGNNNSSSWKPALKTIPELNSPLPLTLPLSDNRCSPEMIYKHAR